MNFLIKLQFIYLLFFFLSLNLFFVHCDNALFTQCKERNGTAKNIQVQINKCNSTSLCRLSRGEEAEMILKFTPVKDSSAEVERLIVAQIPSSKNKLIDVPYGDSMDILSSTFFEQDNQPFVYPIRRDLPLLHRYIFSVLKGTPHTSFTLRYIVREKAENIIQNQRNWIKHPGQLFVCVNVRIELV